MVELDIAYLNNKEDSIYTFQDEAGDRFFKKVRRTNNKANNLLSRIDRSVLRYVISRSPQSKLRSKSQEESLKQEIKVLLNWQKNNINVINPISHSDQEIIFPHIEGPNVYDALNKEIGNIPIFEKAKEQLLIIRTCAKEKQDKNLLHLDPHLRNFLYDEKKDIVYAIDPGACIKEALPFNITDCYLNFVFIYSFLALEAAKKDKANYIESYLQELDQEELNQMKELNKFDSLLYKTYHFVREPIASFMSKRPKRTLEACCNYHTKKNVRLVDSLIDNHIRC